MVYDQPGKVSIKRVSIETPELGAGQVLVRLLVYVVMMGSVPLADTSDRTHTGVCYSDHGLMTNAVCFHAIIYTKSTYSNGDYFK